MLMCVVVDSMGFAQQDWDTGMTHENHGMPGMPHRR